mgnify:CR=1 FL=1
MPGTKTNGWSKPGTIHAYFSAAMTAALYGTEWVATFPGRISAVAVNARTAGTGGGNTVMELFKNGTTMYTTAANRPTLLATSTGAFANTNPDIRSFVPGDVIALQCSTVSTTGHAAVGYTVLVEAQ